jgi:uncharacterized protein YgbK (DUF1537 family)
MEDAQLPIWHEDERVLQLRCATLAARANGHAPLAVVDDDPTGTQTVHSVPVLADWSVSGLASVVTMDRPCFYILANTRALPRAEAAARAEEIGRNLQAAATEAGVGPLTAVVSRGDSTLRGHYPFETDALARGLGWGVKGGRAARPTIVLAPFFKEGGRLTAGDVHYVAGPPQSGADGSAKLTPAGETEFAKDKAFGYTSSYLPAWIAEKSSGAVPEIRSISLDVIRRDGPEGVAELVTLAPAGSIVIANALVPRDMQVIALGCLKAELARGPTRPILYRSAGALVAARAAIPARPLLTWSELAPRRNTGLAGLVVVGSYVSKSSEQLEVLLQECKWLAPVELQVSQLIDADSEQASKEKERVFNVLATSIAKGESAVLYTSRKVLQDDGAGGLKIGANVNTAICEIVRRTLGSPTPPAFLVAKGGITSNDVAVHGVGVRRAEVMGPIVPGVPVWRCGEETRAPGLAYVVFPGNVGAKDDLARVARTMAGLREPGLVVT